MTFLSVDLHTSAAAAAAGHGQDGCCSVVERWINAYDVPYIELLKVIYCATEAHSVKKKELMHFLHPRFTQQI